MVLVSEIADLAVEAAKLSEEEEFCKPEGRSASGKDLVNSTRKPRTTMMPQKGLWSSVRFDHQHKETDDEMSEEEEEEEENQEDQPEQEEEKKGAEETPERGWEPSNQQSDRPHLSRSPSGSILFKNKLEKWDEPQGKLDKVNMTDAIMRKHQGAVEFSHTKNDVTFVLFILIERGGDDSGCSKV